MTELSIDLQPDPDRDGPARRAALALLTAALYDPQDDGPKELTGAALQELVEQVVSEIGGVREESRPALEVMLTAVARQHSAFTGIALALADAAYAAGARGEDLDHLALLEQVRDAADGA